MKIFGIFLIIIFISLVVIFFVSAVNGSKDEGRSIANSYSASSKQYETKSDDQGDVTVEIQPVELNSSQTVFKLSLNTHSVELAYDLAKVSTLRDDQGKTYQPVSWSGGSGGHHLSGNLVFPPVSTQAKMLKLAIKGISNIDRNFEWQL